MYENAPQPEAPRTPCACCRAPAISVVWGHDVCGDCASAWFAQTPNVGAMEATAPPEAVEDVPLSGGRTWRRVKPDWLTQAYEAAAKRWVAERRKVKVAA